jgi:hypothetical protein
MKSWALALSLFAIVFQALVPLAQAIPVDRDSDSPFDSLVICTAWGLKVIKLTTGEEAPVDETTPDKCPVCSVVSLNVALTSSGAIVVPHEDYFRKKLLPRSFSEVPFLFIVHNAAIRAPPALTA